MRKSVPVLAIAGFFLVSQVAGCKRTPEPEARETPPSTVNAGAPQVEQKPEPEHVDPSAITRLKWTDPPGWTRVSSPSPMRIATYKLPKAEGVTEDAEMTVFHFGGGQGGGVEANFDRWLGQFNVEKTQALRSDRSANGMVVHVLEIPKGSFSSAMRPGEKATVKENFGLLGAVVETPAGPYFFKVTGPSKTLEAARPAFIKLLDSVTSAG